MAENTSSEIHNNLINLSRLKSTPLSTEPYEWAFIDRLFAPQDAAALAASFPHDNFKTIRNYDGEKGYAFDVRSLVHMGAHSPSHAERLSPAWLSLVNHLLSPDYRAAMSRLVGRELDSLIMELNVFHYGPGSWLGPHLDLEERLVSHIFYFNDTWDVHDGGCLNILRSPNETSAVFEVSPVAGNSVVLVRSGKSWHAVSPVVTRSPRSRRSMAVGFYLPGSVSTLWPPGDRTPLHDYDETDRKFD